MAESPKPSTLPLRILLLEIDDNLRPALELLMQRESWSIMAPPSRAEVWPILASTVPDIALVDISGEESEMLAFVTELRVRLPDRGIIVISDEETEALATKAADCGADYFLSKPLSPSALVLTVRKLAELQEQRTRVISLERQLQQSIRAQVIPEILTHSDSMKAMIKLIDKISQRDLSVLIQGESGTGKELVAHAIHQNSARARGPFIELNCAALPPNLVESELFGHEKGAFTGAVSSRAGKVEQAQGGTLFLDEIGEMPLEMQPKLLRALQDKRVTRIGGRNVIEVDFRLVSATNRDLAEEVRAGRFREDLFYRIAVFPMRLPPLRARMEDLDLLLASFLQQEGVKSPKITREARELLHGYSWPGNIRELRNFAQAITLYCETGAISEADIRAYFGARLGEGVDPRAVGNAAGGAAPDPFRAVRPLAEIEREEILHALRVHGGNVTEACVALGMGRATLYKYLKKHEIDAGTFGG